MSTFSTTCSGLVAMFLLAACGTPGTGPITTTAPDMAQAQSMATLVSCTTMPAGFKSCSDYAGAGTLTSTYKTNCMQAGGAPGTGCDHTGSVGGCRATAGGVTATVWYYSAMYTASQIMQVCNQGGLSYVAP